jgi:hypothetical protein
MRDAVRAEGFLLTAKPSSSGIVSVYTDEGKIPVTIQFPSGVDF